MSFKKGKSGNPHGRPRGKLNKNTEKILNLKSLINLDTNEINAHLLEHMKKGQAWAFQIYYNKIYDPIKKIKIDNTASSRVQAITQALTNFDLLSHSEILEEMKILKNITEKEEKEQEQNIVESLSDELICQMYNFLNKKEEAK